MHVHHKKALLSCNMNWLYRIFACVPPFFSVHFVPMYTPPIPPIPSLISHRGRSAMPRLARPRMLHLASLLVAGRQGVGYVRLIAFCAAPRVLLWPANGPLTGLRVLFPSRPDGLPPLLYLLLPCPQRLDIPIVPLLHAVPVLLSVRQLSCVPLPPLSVFLRQAAAPVHIPLRDALFGPLRLYPMPPLALGLLSCAPLMHMLPVLPVVPLCVGLRVGLLLRMLVGGELHLPLLVGCRCRWCCCWFVIVLVGIRVLMVMLLQVDISLLLGGWWWWCSVW
jgi:hypothetical protein